MGEGLEEVCGAIDGRETVASGGGPGDGVIGRVTQPVRRRKVGRGRGHCLCLRDTLLDVRGRSERGSIVQVIWIGSGEFTGANQKVGDNVHRFGEIAICLGQF